MSETRTVEATGSDIEQAIEAGLTQLDVSRESVIVEILEEPSRGLLGIGAKMARVRLTTAVPPRSAQMTYQPKPPAPPPPPRPQAQPRPRRPEPVPQPTAPVEAEPPDEEAPRTIERIQDETQLPEDVRQGVVTLREILHYMKIEAEVVIERPLRDNGEPDEEAPWVLHVYGDDLGLLIGHRGETLSSLQYLTRLIAGRDTQHRAEFIIDVENYKGRREMLLRRLAHRMAKEAIRRKRTVELEPMPPHERRIIHLALRDRNDVYTESVGEGNRRKVTIIPKR
jgi:spoIIIJ-associated protein